MVLADNIRAFTLDSLLEIKSEFEDKEFLLGLWSVDCPPCLVELDMMGKILELNPDLPFVLISTDPIETREDAVEFLSDFNLEDRESWMFADGFVERLRYSIDPNWYGELPRSYFYDRERSLITRGFSTTFGSPGIISRSRMMLSAPFVIGSIYSYHQCSQVHQTLL